MGVVSLSEDALDRFISDVSQISSDLGTPHTDPAMSEVKIKACRAACDQIVENLRRAKEIAADPSLMKSQRLDWLQIDNHRLTQSIARLEKNVPRLQNKISEIRAEKDEAIKTQTLRTLAAEKESATLRESLKAQRDETRAIAAGNKAKKLRDKNARRAIRKQIRRK